MREQNKKAASDASALAAKFGELKPDEAYKQVKGITDLQEGRDLWVNRPDKPEAKTILQAILEAAPTDELSKLREVKREEREQIVLRSVVSEYKLDLGRILNAPDVDLLYKQALTEMRPSPIGKPEVVTSFEPGAAAEPPATGSPKAVGGNANKRGYVVTILGSTPNQEGKDFINKKFLDNLRALTPDKQSKARASFYVARVALGEPYKARAGGIGFDRKPGPTTMPIDPFFSKEPKESVNEDWLFKAVLLVVVEPKK